MNDFKIHSLIDVFQSLKELIDELEGWVKPHGAVASAKQAQPVLEPSAKPDTDWLAGTNITVTEKVTYFLLLSSSTFRRKKSR